MDEIEATVLRVARARLYMRRVSSPRLEGRNLPTKEVARIILYNDQKLSAFWRILRIR